MLAPRLLLVLALAGFPAAVFAGTETAPIPELPAVATGADVEIPEAPEVVVSAATVEALEKAGWKAQKDGGLERVEGADKGLIPMSYIEKAEFKWKDGALFYKGSPEAVDPAMFAPILKGLSSFTSAARVERPKAGSALAAWGLPPAVDGRRLYDPDGAATYHGIMLYAILSPRPEQAAKLCVPQTSQALDALTHAYEKAFSKQAPDIAQGDLDRARVLLFAPPSGAPLNAGLKVRPDPAAMLKEYQDQLRADMDAAAKAGDEIRRKDSVEALQVLNNLEKQRVHERDRSGQLLDLTEVPEPGKEAKTDGYTGGLGPDDETATTDYVPLASGLPGLLRALERAGGKPLTPDQQENLIRAFPMGDLVWRMGAQDLWRQGLTGKGVKVAVIDQGIAEHAELDAAVKARVNLTAQRGKGAVGSHGTHVAGIIHALAPDAELRGYAVMAGDEGDEQLNLASEAPFVAAVHRAVKDGNHVINMSLGAGHGPTTELARVVEEYASKGVIFLISAGNSRDATGGIDSPSSAPSAITVGALDSAGRMSDFTSFGKRFDAHKLTTVVKDLFMAPGSNVMSTMPSPSWASDEKQPRYAAMSGTSMAAPALSGVTALLVQDMGAMTLVPNPIEAAQRLKSALVQSAVPMDRGSLPSTVPVDQNFFVVKPLEALEALREAAVPVAAK